MLIKAFSEEDSPHSKCQQGQGGETLLKGEKLNKGNDTSFFSVQVWLGEVMAGPMPCSTEK